jgi:acetylornithine deacetylase/succinyl-diaminopimelate desuccinylase-like protein
MNTTDCERHITGFVSRDFERETHFLAELVRLPSDNPPGDCTPPALQARQLLQKLGFKVELHEVPAEVVKANGMISATNLIVRERFGDGGPTIALNAHGDVVPPGAGWTHEPYGAEIVEEPPHGAVMYGRGVAVSKSDFATYAWALLALRDLERQGVKLHGCVELHLTYDEEVGGGIGPLWLLQEKLSKPDFVICAGFSYAVTTAHNGCLHLEAVIKGKAAHAAIPETGVDALQATVRVLNALYEYRESLATKRSNIPGIGFAKLNVGLIEGGINTNVVPDRVSIRIDRRIIPEESAAKAEADLRSLISKVAAEVPGVSVEMRRILLAEPLVELPAAAPLIAALRNHGEKCFGVSIGTTGVPLYTDARHYAAAGIPTVLYGAGPRTIEEANGHRANENLRLNDLRNATCVVALALVDLLKKSATA